MKTRQKFREIVKIVKFWFIEFCRLLQRGCIALYFLYLHCVNVLTSLKSGFRPPQATKSSQARPAQRCTKIAQPSQAVQPLPSNAFLKANAELHPQQCSQCGCSKIEGAWGAPGTVYSASWFCSACWNSWPKWTAAHFTSSGQKLSVLGEASYIHSLHKQLRRVGQCRQISRLSEKERHCQELQFFMENNKLITSATDPEKFLDLLHHWAAESRQLNSVNILTLLHRSSKHQRSTLTDQILEYVGSQIDLCGQFSSQGIGNALYGLRWQGTGEPVELVLRALAPKIEQCDEQLDPQATCV